MRTTILAAIALVVGATLAAIPAADAPPLRTLSPAEVIALCAADAPKVGDADKLKTTRYLSLHNADPADMEQLAKVMSGLLNGLSDRPTIVVPVRTGDGLLLRIDTLAYGETFAAQWEKLGGPDYIFHADDLSDEKFEEVEEEVEEEYGFWVRPDGSKRAGGRQQFPDEKWQTTRTEKVKKKVRRAKTIHGFAPYLVDNAKDKRAFEDLQGLLGGTDVPVVTAEFFLYQASIQEARSPGYYDFCGIKDLKTFESLIGFARKELAPGFLVELRDAVANSTVTTPDTLRRVVRLRAAGSGYWFTQDSNKRLAKDAIKGNPFKNLGDDYEFQGVEGYGGGPNGLWKTIAANNQGKTVASVPPEIASDSTAPYSDRRVHPNLSCIRCHSDGGLQDVEPWIRNVFNTRPNYLSAKDAAERRKLQEQYVDQHILPHLKSDRERYAAALFEATGMTPKVYADAYAALWEKYAERPVDVARACRDLGCVPDELQDALAKAGGSLDQNLAPLRIPKPRPIPVVLWHESYARAQDAKLGKVRPFKIEEKKR